MSLSCLDNLIGIRGECENTPSLSGLYLNDEPYISLENANKTTERDENSGFELLENSIERAKGKLVNDIYSNLQPKFQFNSVIANSTIGYYQDAHNTVAGINGYLKGIVVEINEHPHVEFFLSSISLFTSTGGSIPILIYDLIDGKLIDTISFTATANEVTTQDVFLQIPNLRQRQRIFIGYLSTGITSYETLIHENYLGCNGCGGSYYTNTYAYFRNAKIDNSGGKFYSSIENANDTGGLSIDYSIKCSLTKTLCGIRESIAYPLLYRSAMEVLLEMMTTKRYNTTTIKLETIVEMQEHYENEYQKVLDNLINNINLPNDRCFKCNSSINIVTTIP